MEAVWSWASNSLETHPWWRTIKAGVFKNRYDYVLGFTAARRTQTSFFFVVFFTLWQVRMDGCTVAARQKVMYISSFLFFLFLLSHVCHFDCTDSTGNSRKRQIRYASPEYIQETQTAIEVVRRCQRCSFMLIVM